MSSPAGPPGITEAEQVVAAIETMPDYDPATCERELQDYSPRAIAAAAVHLAEAGGGGGGTMSLTDLSDVTGEPGPNFAPVYDQDTGVAPLTEVTTREDLDAILLSVATVTWHDIGAPGEPPFQSQFRNIGDPWSPARFRILANSTVRMQGTVTCDDQTIGSATWVPIFTLPPEAAPGANLEFSALTNDNAISRMYVWADGTVVWAGYVPSLGPPPGPIGRLPLNFLSWSTVGPS